jgi:hypothetical protein
MVSRGDIWLVNLDPTVGSEIQKTRPCVIVSPPEMHDHLRTVLAAPMTTGSKTRSVSDCCRVCRQGRLSAASRKWVPYVQRFLDGDMSHCGRRRGAVPVLVARRAPYYIACANLDDWFAPALRPAAAGCHDQDLASWVAMPCGSRTWFECHA